jgi:hypothetical protein
MEKLVYMLWKPTNGATNWDLSLRSELAISLRDAGARNLRLNLADIDVADAAVMRLASSEIPLPDAVVTFWLDSACLRTPVESLLRVCSARLAGYSVCESEPLVNTLCQSPDATRCTGMNHIVFLQVPPRLQRHEWQELWLERHTHVAIETQQTFGYRQNIVVRALIADSPPIDAIIEENFPSEAITDQNAFYRQDTPEQLRDNQKRMYQSVRQFIDMDRMARLPTSQYEFH